MIAAISVSAVVLVAFIVLLLVLYKRFWKKYKRSGQRRESLRTVSCHVDHIYVNVPFKTTNESADNNAEMRNFREIATVTLTSGISMDNSVESNSGIHTAEHDVRDNEIVTDNVVTSGSLQNALRPSQRVYDVSKEVGNSVDGLVRTQPVSHNEDVVNSELSENVYSESVYDNYDNIQTSKTKDRQWTFNEKGSYVLGRVSSGIYLTHVFSSTYVETQSEKEDSAISMFKDDETTSKKHSYVNIDECEETKYLSSGSGIYSEPMTDPHLGGLSDIELNKVEEKALNYTTNAISASPVPLDGTRGAKSGSKNKEYAAVKTNNSVLRHLNEELMKRFRNIQSKMSGGSGVLRK